MATATQITEKVEEYLAPGSYEIEEVDYIPQIDDPGVTFGNKGLKVYASVLYIDMRGSTSVLQQHHKYTVAKIQKAYLHVATQLTTDNNGYVRSFNGDGILAFFPKNTKGTIRDAVKAAMNIKYMLTQKCKGEFERYHTLDFGIGIDDGELLVVKVGTPRNPNNNDLSWIGLPVNTAVRLGDAARSRHHIRISTHVYDNLLDEAKFSKGKNMWESVTRDLHGESQTVYRTSYYWKVSD